MQVREAGAQAHPGAAPPHMLASCNPLAGSAQTHESPHVAHALAQRALRPSRDQLCTAGSQLGFPTGANMCHSPRTNTRAAEEGRWRGAGGQLPIVSLGAPIVAVFACQSAGSGHGAASEAGSQSRLHSAACPHRANMAASAVHARAPVGRATPARAPTVVNVVLVSSCSQSRRAAEVRKSPPLVAGPDGVREQPWKRKLPCTLQPVHSRCTPSRCLHAHQCCTCRGCGGLRSCGRFLCHSTGMGGGRQGRGGR